MFQKPNNGHHCALAAETCRVLFRLCRIYLKPFPSLPAGRRRETRNDTKGEQKREISRDFFFFFLVRVIQAVSPSAMKPVTQPANKPTGPFHSAGPLARDQLMPPNKELLSCITSPQRGHAGFGFLSPGSASLQHKASTSPASLLPSPIISHHYARPRIREGFRFRVHKRPRCMSKWS